MKKIRDKHNKVIALIENQKDQKIIRRSGGTVLGRYNKDNDTTYDEHNNRVGTGDQLTSLIR